MDLSPNMLSIKVEKMKDREQIHLNNDVINKYQYSADMFQQYLQ
jgi:hypothetical protein